MSKPIRKVLPEIPVGVEPAPSPRLAHSKGHPAIALLAHSPLLPRSQLPHGKAKRDLQQHAAQSSVLLKPGATTGNSASSGVLEPGASGKSGLLEPGKTAASVQRVSVDDGEDCAVTVAVRVRPFSKRELALDAQQVISMAANRTTITSTKGKAHFFSYDHSFWSVCDPDDPGVGAGRDSVYASQELVYTELAQPLLDSSFRGYNTCLFAYGQTGSGKSYCIMGEGENLGIVPRFMRELFERIDGTSDSKNTYNVQVSYFEIYNEKVYDLLSHSAKRYSSGSKKRPKLRVREHKVFGPYVEDLSTYVATSYSDIEHWLAVGNRCRATNATSMNDRSSRSHAVFSVTLTHTTVEQEQEHNTVSHINIIDLAGSERSKVAETTGDRLKEGASINRSLHSLGKVISLLSERSTGRRAKVYIPYRDSTLTWLLKESLGGNSKTAMIATISPADTHYEESLSTLRYAQQARNIVNVARINEDPNVKMIRELTTEIHHLRGILAEQGGEAGLVELRKLRDQLSESEKLMSEATRSWEEKLQETEQRKKEELEEVKRTGALVLNNKLPNLVNLTEDPQLSETLLYVLKPGRTTVGNMGARDEEGSGQSHDIELTGALVVKDHCVFVHEGTTVQLQPSSSPEAQTFLNGQLLSAPTTLHHGDRVVLGGDYFFRFNYPMEVDAGSSTIKKGHRDFEFARNEWVKAQTSRMEEEWEEKLLKEREQMLCELEGAQRTAQAEMDRQQQEFQDKIHTLNREMETQSQHLTAEQRTKQEAVLLAEELKRRNQALEEETIAQRHIIHLEKIKTEQESRELEEQRNQLMMDLEQEKQRLEEDITKLHKNKSMRESHLSPSPSESLLVSGQSSSSDCSLHRGSQLVHVSMMLQEAAAICKALNKPLVFSREEGGNGGVTVRVSNTLHKMVAHWDLSKFECRLEQMREIYQTRGSASSLEEAGTTSPTLSEDPFNDPADDWAPSPLRSLHHSHSLQSTPVSLATPTSLGRVPHFDPYHSKSSHYNSPLLVTTPHRERPQHPSRSAVAGVLKEIGQVLDWREGEESTRLVDRMCGHISMLKTQSEQFFHLLQHPNKIDGEGVVGAAVSMCCCLEKMVETCHCMQTMALQWRTVMPHYHLKEHVAGVGVVSQLQETLCHQTALYCRKLLRSEGGEGSVECCEQVHTSLDSVAQLLGQLLLVTATQQKLLTEHVAGQESPGEEAMSWPECSLKCGLRQGVCQRCMADLDFTAQTLRSNLSTLSSCDPSSQVPRSCLEAMQQLITTALKFIEWLHALQEEVWHDENDTPSFPDVVTMVMALHQVGTSFSSMTAAVVDHCTPSQPADLKSLTSSPGGKCQQLAVAVLGMLRTTQQGTAHTAHVQTHSQHMAKAAKHLNQLLKTSPTHH